MGRPLFGGLNFVCSGVAAARMNAFLSQAKARGKRGLPSPARRTWCIITSASAADEGISASVHGGAVRYDMVLRFCGSTAQFPPEALRGIALNRPL